MSVATCKWRWFCATNQSKKKDEQRERKVKPKAERKKRKERRHIQPTEPHVIHFWLIQAKALGVHTSTYRVLRGYMGGSLPQQAQALCSRRAKARASLNRQLLHRGPEWNPQDSGLSAVQVSVNCMSRQWFAINNIESIKQFAYNNHNSASILI